MAKFDQGGGCPCGLYRECEPGCAYDPDMVLLAENAKARASALQSAREAVVEAAVAERRAEIAFVAAAESERGATAGQLLVCEEATSALRAATDRLIELENQT